jgi:hypothetical protein
LRSGSHGSLLSSATFSGSIVTEVAGVSEIGN